MPDIVRQIDSAPPSRSLGAFSSRCFGVLRRYGPKSTLTIIRASTVDALFDLRYGVRTGQNVGLSDLEVVGENKNDGTFYAPVKVLSFRSALASFQIPLDGVFVDYGAGKGRVLLLAILSGFQRVVGVEFAQALCIEAEQSLDTFRDRTGRQFEANVLNVDAADYSVDDDDCVFFLYNSFNKKVLEQVLSNIRHSLQSKPRSVHFVYAYPVHRQLLDDDPFWCKVAETKSNIFDTFVYYRPS